MTWDVTFSKAIVMARSKLKESQNGDGDFLTVLVFAALYFIQKWTGLPVFDWAISVLKWISYDI